MAHRSLVETLAAAKVKYDAGFLRRIGSKRLLPYRRHYSTTQVLRRISGCLPTVDQSRGEARYSPSMHEICGYPCGETWARNDECSRIRTAHRSSRCCAPLKKTTYRRFTIARCLDIA